MTREELLNKVKNELPETSGVYIMKDVNDEVIYVGKAKILKRRVKSYFDNTTKRDNLAENYTHITKQRKQKDYE